MPGQGSAPADILFVGEAPGRFGADKSGVPFTNDRSGLLFRRVIGRLEEAHGQRLATYVTNIVKCNPTDGQGRNRPPRPAEVENCKPWLAQEISLARPKVVVPLGRLAATAVLGSAEFEWWVPRATNPCVYPAKHPGYVVRGGGSERLTEATYTKNLIRVLDLVRLKSPSSIKDSSMVRRVFISYEGEDRNRAKGFSLLKWNENTETEFFDRHLLDPVQSNDPDYVKRVVRDRMHGTSVTIVLIGEKTHESAWVDWEIRETLDNGKGVLGIRVKDGPVGPVPDALLEAGAEVIDWDHNEFNDAIERAALAGTKVGGYTPGTSLAGCAR